MRQFIKNMFYRQREDFNREYANRNDRFTFPDNVTMTLDIPYAPDHDKAHRLDIFQPNSAPSSPEALPVS